MPRRIIQFMHRGKEILPHQLINGWNLGRHGRRLLRHEGNYVDARGNYLSGDLAFWNEYEAPTRHTPIQGGLRGWQYAENYHEIIVPVPPKPSGRRRQYAACCCNTDPCVFGDTFKYSNCQQVPNGVLWNVPVGSVILFCAHKDNLFALDTVFVVGQTGIPYSVPVQANQMPFVVSQNYHDVTLGNLLPRPYRRHMINQFMFYRGANVMHRNGRVEGTPIYSFTPARIFNSQNYNERCMIDLAQLNNHVGQSLQNCQFSVGKTQGFKDVFTGPSADVEGVWKEVRDQVLNQGFVLGVHFDW